MKVKINRISQFISCIPLLIFMWILFGFNTYNGDYGEYELSYQLGRDSGLEKGYVWLQSLCKDLGISRYQDFLIIISAVLLIVIFCTAFKYTEKPLNVLFLFLLFPFFALCETVRFAFVFCIILVGIIILSRERKYSVPIFLLLVYIASLFNTSALLYIVLPLYKVRISKKNKMILLAAAMCIIVFASYSDLLYLIALRFGMSIKILRWLQGHARVGMFIPISEQLFSFYTLRYAYVSANKRNVQTIINGRVLYEINFMMLILIPFYFITSVFIRLFYVILFFNIMYIYEILYAKNTDYVLKISKLGMLNILQVVIWSFVNIVPRVDIWGVHFKYNSVLYSFSNF